MVLTAVESVLIAVKSVITAVKIFDCDFNTTAVRAASLTLYATHSRSKLYEESEGQTIERYRTQNVQKNILLPGDP